MKDGLLKYAIILIFWLTLLDAKAVSNGQYLNPVLERAMPDPTVIQGDDGLFYVFATGTNPPMNIPIYKSPDLVNWSFEGYTFPEDQKPKEIPKWNIWAPDVIKYKDKYLLAYSLSAMGEYNHNGIGLAISDKANGPYTNLGIIFTSEESGVKNSIDPSLYEENGKLYLIWGSFHGIYICDLKEINNPPYFQAETTQKIKLAGDAFEGTHIYKRGGWYYLFASTGFCCKGDLSTYRVVVGRSQNLFGPYVDYDGNQMLQNSYDLVLTGTGIFSGPGHGSTIIEDDEKKTWYIYHSYKRGASNKGRMLMLDEIQWSNEDWPYIRQSIPSNIKRDAPRFTE